MYAQGGLLPVELHGFNAVLDGQQVVLTWETLSETNNAGFAIERAGEDGVFSEIGFVEGNGTTNEPSSYSYADESYFRQASTLQYRLRQVDFDGTVAYSPVINVALPAPHAVALHANYPNPFNPETTIAYDVPREGHVRLSVFDLTGREVRVILDGQQPAGRHQVAFDASGLASGTYYYRLQTDGKVLSRPLVLSR